MKRRPFEAFALMAMRKGEYKRYVRRQLKESNDVQREQPAAAPGNDAPRLEAGEDSSGPVAGRQ